MRITEQCLEIFVETWSKYDKDGTLLIEIDDLKELLTDLATEELKIKNNREVCLFDLTSNPYIKLYVQWKKNIDHDKEAM
jgi:hypothetical protein